MTPEEEIIQLRFTNDSLCSEENRTILSSYYSAAIKLAKSNKFWDESIKAIIITDNLEKEVESVSKKWKIKASISKEKEYRVVSKILFNQKIDIPEYYILIPFQNFYSDNLLHNRIILSQIITIFSKNLIPLEIRRYQILNSPESLDDYLKLAAIEWITAENTRRILNTVFNDTYNPFNHNSFLISFKRKLKKYLYEYNSGEHDPDWRLSRFWQYYFDSIKTLFLRITETGNKEKEIQIDENEPCQYLLYNVVSEITILSNNFLNNQIFDITNLKKAVQQFSAFFDVLLTEESTTSIRIQFTKNPKDYFVGELVETEPRLVCFIDILGFSELIDEYDSNITSTVLQDIQESFSLARKHIIENSFILSNNKDLINHLGYQTFSDNICISIPYFNNADDFLSNFRLLTTYVRSLQFVLMYKGFFTRGGISIGSFYSDNNIIFSKGLVNAYLLESKKAVYPRIVIDKMIIDKILSYNYNSIKQFSLNDIIVFDWENVAFLNPFLIINTSIQQLKYLSIDYDENDPMLMDLKSLSTLVTKMTTDLLDKASDSEATGMETIKSIISDNIIKYHENEHIISKYTWLREFIKWIENDDSTDLRFHFIKEKLESLR